MLLGCQGDAYQPWEQNPGALLKPWVRARWLILAAVFGLVIAATPTAAQDNVRVCLLYTSDAADEL